MSEHDEPRSNEPRSDEPRPDQERSDRPRSDEARPAEARPDEPRSDEALPAGARPAEARPAEPDRAEPELVEPAALKEELLEHPEEGEREVTAEQLSLARRLRQPRTIISILVPIVITGVFFYLNWDQLSKVPSLIANADPLLVLAAFVVFYLGFPLRGYRWSLLLLGTGFRIRTKDSTEILYLSWLVNCVVPAKLGDVYRAYLLKINSTASLSRTFGTVFIERVLDLFAIAILGLAAGYWSFRSGLPEAIKVVFIIGFVVIVVLAIGLFSMRNFGRRILTVLPLPARILEFYDRFEQGVFGAIGVRQFPLLALLTGLIWMTESLRLWLVVQALGFPDVSLGLSGAVFVALIGSLLTAVPLSPAGLGFVQAGIIGVLTVAYDVPLAEATAIALLDWVISVLSIIVFGSIVYVLSDKPRGEGRIVEQPAPA